MRGGSHGGGVPAWKKGVVTTLWSKEFLGE
jgi:hypothetical protein